MVFKYRFNACFLSFLTFRFEIKKITFRFEMNDFWFCGI